MLSSVLSDVNGVADVQIEDEAELLSYLNSELGLEVDRVATAAAAAKGGFAEILVVMLFFLILTELGSDNLDLLPLMEESVLVLDCGGVFSNSQLDCSISLFSHGFAAIQRSNQLHPELLLSNSLLLLRDGTDTFVLKSKIWLDFNC